MIVYGVGMLPLTRLLKTEVSELLQPWYADDAAAGGKFNKIMEYYLKLREIGSGERILP